MAIKVELSPEDEFRLTQAASAHGVGPERYARDLLRMALVHDVRPKGYDSVAAALETETGARTVEQFHTMLQALAAGADRLPNLTTESFTRESFYEDRNIASDA
jgi:hypothetical protein